MKNRSLFSNIFVKNILIAVIVFIVLVFVVLWWLDIYTNHGKQVAVPDVKGLQVAEAAPFFQQKALQYAIVDSVFVKNKTPGSILETIPPVGTNVKEGRTIYLTVNAHSAQLLTIPEVKDMSQRQAYAMLLSLGFESVKIQTVPGAYKDLVLGLETRGRALEAGVHLPADAVLSLLVSSGEEEIFSAEEEGVETVELDPEESWY
ncbi:MAG: PASTA domain-containing protein [Candidatus Symbiothrix sp.]|jgi:beta-lactam-binding protein with PASTA domain|nr:PASTA domain-containing protein [Candidatus Symbiothrix sp.]